MLLTVFVSWVHSGSRSVGPASGYAKAHDPDGGAPTFHDSQLRQDCRSEFGRGTGAGNARPAVGEKGHVFHVSW